MATLTQYKTWLVVGASRGIGHEFVRQLLNRGDSVHATVRNSSAKHNATFWTETDVSPGKLVALERDVLTEDSIDACVASLTANAVKHIDCAVINAGVLKYPNHATEISYNDFAFHLHTNTIGPIIFAQRLLKSGISVGTIVFISSDSGSAGRFLAHEDGFGAYGASKAALNHMGRHMAAELRRKGSQTTILMLHPGEVTTDMTNIGVIPWTVEGEMLPEESVAACLQTIESKQLEDSGSFWTWKNERYTW